MNQAFNWDLLVPYKYANQYVTLRQLEQIMLRDYHPEFVRRFIGWLHYKNGNVGAGGLSRTEQPNKPGFAPSLLVTFHWAGQQYNDGITGACAVDTVFTDGPDPGDAHDGIPWTEVPIQGTAEAVRWGIHANVGVPGKGESWHLQPIEIDGHASWVAAGRPAPVRGYPIPPEHDPYHQPEPVPPIQPEGDPDMIMVDYTNPTSGQWTALTFTGTQLAHTSGHADAVIRRVPGVPRVAVNDVELDGLIASVQTTTPPPPEFSAARQAAWNARRG